MTPPLDWRIVPVPSRACLAVNLPFGRILEQVLQPWSVRYFGPLARLGGDDETIAIPSEPAAEGLSPERLGRRAFCRVDTAVPTPVLHFTTWNPAAADRAAWAVLMFMLLVGAAIRRRRTSLIRKLVPLILAALWGLAWAAP